MLGIVILGLDSKDSALTLALLRIGCQDKALVFPANSKVQSVKSDHATAQ